MNYWTLDKIAKHAQRQGRKVTARWLRIQIERGLLKAIMPGMEYLVEEEEAERWIKEWTKSE